jgi:hypothetical protein
METTVVLCDGTEFTVVKSDGQWWGFPVNDEDLDWIEGETKKAVMEQLEELDDLAFYYPREEENWTEV